MLCMSDWTLPVRSPAAAVLFEYCLCLMPNTIFCPSDLARLSLSVPHTIKHNPKAMSSAKQPVIQ